MKKRVLGIIVTGLISFSNSVLSSDSNWTAQISKVISYESGVVAVVLEGQSNPNPSTATFSCDADIVYLSSKSNEAPNVLVSAALTAYTAGKTVRIGVNGSGNSCTSDYLTLQ